MSADATNAARPTQSAQNVNMTRTAQSGPRVTGRGGRVKSHQLFHYDVDAGLQGLTATSFVIDQSDRMGAVEARRTSYALHTRFGIAHEPEAVLTRFDTALWLAQALNSSSQLVPAERVNFSFTTADSRSAEFSYSDVMNTLGIDARRYFRRYAQYINAAVRQVYDYRGEDEAILELRDEIIAAADKRGLARYPYLLSDVADADSTLNDAERAAVVSSKARVLSNSNNSVDARAANMAMSMRSSDNYDSSVPRAAESRYHD